MADRWLAQFDKAADFVIVRKTLKGNGREEEIEGNGIPQGASLDWGG